MLQTSIIPARRYAKLKSATEPIGEVSQVNVGAGPHTSTRVAPQDHRVLGTVGAHLGHADSMAKAEPPHQLDTRSDHFANERKQL